jgi:hypothetical protein
MCNKVFISEIELDFQSLIIFGMQLALEFDSGYRASFAFLLNVFEHVIMCL